MTDPLPPPDVPVPLAVPSAQEARPRVTNGWRSGSDPAQRVLRIVSSVVVLGVFTFLAVRSDRGIDDLGVIALAVGTLLVLLGYEGLIRLPWIGTEHDDPKEGP